MPYCYQLANHDTAEKKVKYVIKSKRELSLAELQRALTDFIEANPHRHYFTDEVIELPSPE